MEQYLNTGSCRSLETVGNFESHAKHNETHWTIFSKEGQVSSYVFKRYLYGLFVKWIIEITGNPVKKQLY